VIDLVPADRRDMRRRRAAFGQLHNPGAPQVTPLRLIGTNRRHDLRRTEAAGR
jgi:hypothetical protein